jgi:hypothetical protein
VGRPNLRWKKDDNTTISLVWGVGMSSPIIGRHRSTSRSRKNAFMTSLRISLSYAVDFWNISGWEEAMVWGENPR